VGLAPLLITSLAVQVLQPTNRNTRLVTGDLTVLAPNPSAATLWNFKTCYPSWELACFFCTDNRLYRPPMILVALLSNALTSVCSFPATVKVILLMGVNVFVVTFAIIAMN
jgi:hypothetical protein